MGRSCTLPADSRPVHRAPGGAPVCLQEVGAAPHWENRASQDSLGAAWMLAGLRRHRWTAAGVWLAVTLAAAAWTSRQPALYRSEALVLVESRRIPERLIPVGEAADLQKRLELARQKLLSSRELMTVIRALYLYPDRRLTGAADESLLAEFRRSVSFEREASSHEPSGPIRIAVEYQDAATAARVANHLAVRFIEEVTSARRMAYTAASRFLATHVASAKRELELREAALRQFRLLNSEELPEQVEALRANERRLRAELAALRGEIQALEREKTALEQAAGPQSPKLDGSASPRSPVRESTGASGAAVRPSQVDTLRTRLTALLALYQPAHPDVRRLQAELAEAERLESEVTAQSPAEPKPNGVHPELHPLPPGNLADTLGRQQIQARLETLAARRIQAAAELGTIEQRLQLLPLRQQELAALTREQAFFAEQFRSLAARLQSAQMAEALERSYPPERVVLLEEARPSAQPVGAKRWAMLAAASVGGLLVGCLLALARTLQVPAVRGQAPVVANVRGATRAAVPT